MADARSDIEIRPFRPQDEAAFLDFYAHHQATWESFRRYWEWRRAGVPHSGGEEATIALDGGKVVGAVGIVEAPLTFQGARVRASWQQDSLVSSAMRGRGVGKKLVHAAWQGWDLSIAKGTSGAMYGLRKSVGYVDVPNSDYLVRVLRVRKEGQPIRKTLQESLLLAWKSLLPMPKPDPTIPLVEIDEFDESFTQLAEALSQEPVFRLYKSREYLNWRYTRCPDRRYQILRAGGDQARGAVVVRSAGDRLDEGWIVDLVGCSSDKHAAYALIRKAVEHLTQQDVSRIFVFATHRTVRAWLRRFGFLPTGRSPKFTYRIVRDPLPPLPPEFSSAPWDFYHGDGDVELYM